MIKSSSTKSDCVVVVVVEQCCGRLQCRCTSVFESNSLRIVPETIMYITVYVCSSVYCTMVPVAAAVGFTHSVLR
jgi:hypothetical protein